MSSSDDFFSNELASPPKQSTSLKSRTSSAVRKGPPPPPPKRAGASATTATTTTTRRPSSTRPRTTTAAPSSSSSSTSARRSARPLATSSTTTSPPTSSSSSTSNTMRSRTAPSQNRPVGSYYQSGSSTTASAPAAKASTESWDWSPSPAPAPATDFSSWAAPAPTAITTNNNNTGASDWYSSSTSLSAPVDPSPEATKGGIYTSSGFANPMTSQPQHQLQQSSAGFYGSAPAAQPTASTSNPAFLSGRMDQQAGAATAPTIMNPAAFVPSQTDASNQNTTGAFDGEEAPLLEEIGVNIEHITTKSRAVVLPFSRRWGLTIMDPSQIVQDADLAGPIAFALILGAEMVLAGKLQFGAIYGFGVFGCLSMTLIVNLMSPSAEGISVWTVSSVLGYALIPVNLLAAVKLVVINLASLLTLGRILGLLTVAWSTIASTRLLELGCGLREQRYLIAYPIVLLYSAFVMITIF